MANEITYLFGAGASYYSMPLVENFPQRFDIFRAFLNGVPGFDKKDFLKEYCDRFSNEVKHHLSFDTFFKKLFHLPNESSETYKGILLLFFLFEHLLDVNNFNEFREPGTYQKIFGIKKSNQDPRYEALIAGLLQPIGKRFLLSTKVNFITWNYDLNILSAIINFIEKDIHIDKFIRKYETAPNLIKINDDATVIHLNGLIHHPSLNTIGPIEIENLKRIFEELIDDYFREEKGIAKLASSLNFSWETLAQQSSINNIPMHIEEAIKAIKRSATIIIVGYSFPLYNRQIDSTLINKNNLTNKRVYIQDPKASEIEGVLRNDFGLGNLILAATNSSNIPGIDIRRIENCNSFFVPSSIFPKPIIDEIIESTRARKPG